MKVFNLKFFLKSWNIHDLRNTLKSSGVQLKIKNNHLKFPHNHL